MAAWQYIFYLLQALSFHLSHQAKLSMEGRGGKILHTSSITINNFNLFASIVPLRKTVLFVKTRGIRYLGFHHSLLKIMSGFVADAAKSLFSSYLS